MQNKLPVKILSILAILGLCYFSWYTYNKYKTEKISPTQIHKTYDLDDVLKYVKKDSLVIFDIDRTLIMPEELKVNDPILLDKRLANKNVCLLWNKNWKKYISIKMTQPNIPRLIKQLQDSGIKVMLHTARPINLKDITKEQLNMFGINMTRNTIHNKDIEVKPYDDQNGLLFSNGILMTEKNKKLEGRPEKGNILLKFLKKISYQPKNIIFIDDNKKNIDSVIKTLRPKGISVIALWYKPNENYEFVLFDPELYESTKCTPKYI